MIHATNISHRNKDVLKNLKDQKMKSYFYQFYDIVDNQGKIICLTTFNTLQLQ